MSIFHDIIFKPTSGELELRAALRKARDHAEELEESLCTPDPEEFTNPRRHVEICFNRQIAAHAWRKALFLHSELNGAEMRRYARGLIIMVAVGFVLMLALEGGVTAPNLLTLVKAFGAAPAAED